MKTKYIALLATVMFVAGGYYAFSHILDRPAGSIKEKFYEPHEIIEMYLNAVARGELVVFEQRLDKSMLMPVRVEYVYELNSAITIVKVYSKLKQPMSVPMLEHCTIRAVSAILDADGHIVETEVHISPE